MLRFLGVIAGGGSKRFTLNVNGGGRNRTDLGTLASQNGWKGQKEVILNLSGDWISDLIGEPAVYTGSWPAGTRLTVNIQGGCRLMGRGGDAGVGAIVRWTHDGRNTSHNGSFTVDRYATGGGPGGEAFRISAPISGGSVTVNNYGQILAGGGGAGGGGATLLQSYIQYNNGDTSEYAVYQYWSNGGDGGVGQGWDRGQAGGGGRGPLYNYNGQGGDFFNRPGIAGESTWGCRGGNGGTGGGWGGGGNQGEDSQGSSPDRYYADVWRYGPGPGGAPGVAVRNRGWCTLNNYATIAGQIA